jgi:hypothetical protein
MTVIFIIQKTCLGDLVANRRIIKIDLREVGWECVDWIYLIQCGDKYRGLINTLLYIRDQKNSGKFLTRV